MGITIRGATGIDMGNSPISNISQIDSTVINENGVKVTSDVFNKPAKGVLFTKISQSSISIPSGFEVEVNGGC